MRKMSRFQKKASHHTKSQEDLKLDKKRYQLEGKDWQNGFRQHNPVIRCLQETLQTRQYSETVEKRQVT